MSRSSSQRKMPVMGMSHGMYEPEQGYREGRPPQSRQMPQQGYARRKSRFSFAGKAFGLVLRNPLDSLAIAAAVIMAGSIINNALFQQNSSHPAPIFGNAATPTSPPAAQTTEATIAGLAANAGTTPTQNNTSQMEVVRTIQAQLAARGLYNGTVDGVFGPRTSAAISAYESAAGMRITGSPSVEVMHSLTGQATSGTAASTQVTAPGSQVLAVQHVLAEQGFGPLKVDGVFGETTRQAIRKFEASRNLPQNGELTPQVLKELSAVSGVVLN